MLRSSYLRIATVTMKYIESQYLNSSALVQIDSEFGLSPATRELSGLHVPYDAEVSMQEAAGSRQIKLGTRQYALGTEGRRGDAERRGHCGFWISDCGLRM